jgi:hypothetical protein
MSCFTSGGNAINNCDCVCVKEGSEVSSLANGNSSSNPSLLLISPVFIMARKDIFGFMNFYNIANFADVESSGNRLSSAHGLENYYTSLSIAFSPVLIFDNQRRKTKTRNYYCCL